MSKDNFVIADTNIRAVTQQLLIYLCGYYNSHKYPNNSLQEGDLVVIKDRDLYVFARGGVPKLKLELGAGDRKLYNYVQGPSVIDVLEDKVVHQYMVVIYSYIGLVSASAGVELDTNRNINVVKVIDKADLVKSQNDELSEDILLFNHFYDMWKYSLYVLLQSRRVDMDILNTLRLSTDFLIFNTVKLYSDVATVYLTPECLYIKNNEDDKAGECVAHVNNPCISTHQMVSKIFECVPDDSKTDIFENAINPFVDLAKLLSINEKDVPTVITEYNSGYCRSVVCVDKKGDIRVLLIGSRVSTMYGEDIGKYAFESANEEQRREWLKLVRKNPQIDLHRFTAQ